MNLDSLMNTHRPVHCGQMDLTIKANGEWWHEGQHIQRKNLIQLFSTVLCLENGQYFLKTPVEKIQITVEDCPFFITNVERIARESVAYLQFLTTTQDVIIADAQHPIVMRAYQGAWRPYVHVRDGMYGLIQRSVFYHLLEYGELLENEQGDVILCLTSGECEFRLHQVT